MKTVASKRYSNKSNLLKQNLLSEAHGFTEDKNGSAGGETAGAESSRKKNVFPVLGNLEQNFIKSHDGETRAD
jgi:hypothetical protein